MIESEHFPRCRPGSGLELVNQLSYVLLIANFAATWYMVGLIWQVQIVHYPLLSGIGADQFPKYHRQHANRITPVVGLPMLIELATAVLLYAASPLPQLAPLLALGLGLVIAVWVSTAALQIPCHSRLSHGFDPRIHRWLVLSNWIRTLAWTSRGVVMAYVLWLLASGPIPPNQLLSGFE